MLDEKEEIRKQLMIFVSDAASNSLIAHGGMPIYDVPLMAIAGADDPMFDKLKEPGVSRPGQICAARFSGWRKVCHIIFPTVYQGDKAKQPEPRFAIRRMGLSPDRRGDFQQRSPEASRLPWSKNWMAKEQRRPLNPCFRCMKWHLTGRKDMSLILPVSVHLVCTGI